MNRLFYVPGPRAGVFPTSKELLWIWDRSAELGATPVEAHLPLASELPNVPGLDDGEGRDRWSAGAGKVVVLDDLLLGSRPPHHGLRKPRPGGRRLADESAGKWWLFSPRMTEVSVVLSSSRVRMSSGQPDHLALVPAGSSRCCIGAAGICSCPSGI